MVLKIKLSHEETIHEKGLSLYKNCTSASVSLNWDKEAAASNSLLSSSSELDFIRIKKQSQWKKPVSAVGLSYTFTNSAKLQGHSCVPCSTMD